jgi:ribosomal protein L39E
MATKISSELKQKLISAKKKNKRAPIWIYLKTRRRRLIRTKKRNWRFDKLSLKTPHKKKARRRLIIKHKIRAKQ